MGIDLKNVNLRECVTKELRYDNAVFSKNELKTIIGKNYEYHTRRVIWLYFNRKFYGKDKKFS